MCGGFLYSINSCAVVSLHSSAGLVSGAVAGMMGKQVIVTSITKLVGTRCQYV